MFFLRIKNFFINKLSKISVKSNRIEISNFDNSDFRDEKFKKNILFTVLFLSLTFIFTFSYIYFNKSLNIDSDSSNIPPLKIIIPYPNSSINIDDYDILKYQIKPGDNLINILTTNIGVSNSDAQNVINALNKVYSVSNIKAGQVLEIKYRILINQNETGSIDEKVVIQELTTQANEKDTEITVTSRDDNKYEAKKTKIVLTKNYLKYKVRIDDNLFVDGVKAGIPQAIMLDFIKYFSFDIDFQRDLRKGDTFEVLFEEYFNDEGKRIRDGDILYASLNNQNKEYEMYRFDLNGTTSYYNSNGQSVQKSLLKTPINGARISSGYGMRRHPILGYSKMHAGKDFAAPTGTPIFAAGTGTIEIAKFWSTWGNYIKIKHRSGYETEYAHANRIAKGIYPGIKVKQGQVIAYVGTTGRSTGPHLHFGLLFNGRRINPDSVKSLPTLKLIGRDLIAFRNEVDKINLYRRNIPNQNLTIR